METTRKFSCRDHQAVRALVVSKIPKLPQAKEWVASVFGGDKEKFKRFLQEHSKDGAWTDDSGIICQVRD